MVAVADTSDCQPEPDWEEPKFLSRARVAGVAAWQAQVEVPSCQSGVHHTQHCYQGSSLLALDSLPCRPCTPPITTALVSPSERPAGLSSHVISSLQPMP